jgi:hypothetical protein
VTRLGEAGWRAERTAWFHAGMRFDPMPDAEQSARQRFLVDCIRT